MLKIKFPDITKKWIHTPYIPYSNIPKEGCDCFSMLLDFLEYYGLKIPEEYKGITRKNYFDLWNKDQNKAVKLITQFLNEITKEKDIKNLRSGDIIIYKVKNKDEKYFTIYSGNGKFINVTPRYGVSFMKTRNIEILKVFQGFK